MINWGECLVHTYAQADHIECKKCSSVLLLYSGNSSGLEGSTTCRHLLQSTS